MKNKALKSKYYIGLFIATVIWGFSFIVVKESTRLVPVLYLLGIRYLIASLGMAFIVISNLKKLNKEMVLEGLVLGGVLFVSQYLQTVGCKYTTAGKNAFITTIYVIVVPFLYWGIKKIKPTPQCISAAVLAMVGVAFLSLQGTLVPNIGDLLTIFAGIGLSIHIVCTDSFTENNSPIVLAALQFVFAGIISWGLIGARGYSFPMVIIEPAMIGSMLYLGVFSTMIAFGLQTICQKYLEPNISALILTMEAITGMMFSIILLNETFTLRILIGCAFMLGAMFLAR